MFLCGLNIFVETTAGLLLLKGPETEPEPAERKTSSRWRENETRHRATDCFSL